MQNKVVIERLQNLKYLGDLKNSNVAVLSRQNSFKDVVKFFAKINEDDIITEIKFKANGCSTFLAYCSFFCEIAEGKTIKDSEKNSKNKLLKIAELGDNHIHVIDIILETFSLLIVKFRNGVLKGKIQPFKREEDVKAIERVYESKKKNTFEKKLKVLETELNKYNKAAFKSKAIPKSQLREKLVDKENLKNSESFQENLLTLNKNIETLEQKILVETKVEKTSVIREIKSKQITDNENKKSAISKTENPVKPENNYKYDKKAKSDISKNKTQPVKFETIIKPTKEEKVKKPLTENKKEKTKANTTEKIAEPTEKTKNEEKVAKIDKTKTEITVKSAKSTSEKDSIIITPSNEVIIVPAKPENEIKANKEVSIRIANLILNMEKSSENKLQNSEKKQNSESNFQKKEINKLSSMLTKLNDSSAKQKIQENTSETSSIAKNLASLRQKNKENYESLNAKIENLSNKFENEKSTESAEVNIQTKSKKSNINEEQTSKEKKGLLSLFRKNK